MKQDIFLNLAKATGITVFYCDLGANAPAPAFLSRSALNGIINYAENIRQNSPRRAVEYYDNKIARYPTELALQAHRIDVACYQDHNLSTVEQRIDMIDDFYRTMKYGLTDNDLHYPEDREAVTLCHMVNNARKNDKPDLADNLLELSLYLLPSHTVLRKMHVERFGAIDGVNTHTPKTRRFRPRIQKQRTEWAQSRFDQP